MSWTLYTQVKAPSEIREALEKQKQASLDLQPFDSWDDDVEEQMAAATDAAESLVKLLDTQDGPVNVNASGHAKRSDEDTVSVSVSVNRGPKPKKS